MEKSANSSGLHTILDIFAAISAIPRCSGNEGGIASWLGNWARDRGFDSSTDQAGNVVIRIPASPGKEGIPPLILQNHMDMVCEKGAQSHHDFTRDMLQLVVVEDWLSAAGTSLGADNGIGMAIALALAAEKDLRRPALELLFTVEEETGLTGAQNLDPSLLRGRRLINIDSEKEGLFTIGCAGGENIHLHLPVRRETLPADYLTATISVGGLQGGHSGMDIAKGRGNAIRILAEILTAMMKTVDLRLVSLTGGTRCNVIPRQAQAVIAFHAAETARLQEQLAGRADEAAKNLALADPDIVVVSLSSPAQAQSPVLSLAGESAAACLRLLLEIPQGVRRLEKNQPPQVATSNNLAVVRSEEDALKVLSLQRSSRMAELAALTREIGETAQKLGAGFTTDGRWPAWEPDPGSALLRRCVDVYRQTFAVEPALYVTHGGLECGVLGTKLPGVEMVSLGPDIENPHSPGERVLLPSIARVHHFLKALLENLT
ncbi:MAG: aminoacyl-histidine dipeptidase [Deltaproteobacteria bacterium]|nr:aminoacyl-histidine dipeptidase [Deltaproteobacteria bacterium]